MTAIMEREAGESAEAFVARIKARVDHVISNPPRMPLVMLFKLIWHAVRGRRVKRFDLGPPYEIQFEE
jgi:hypothetical protein